MSIDRKALVQAVSNGVFLPGNQLVPPTSPFYIKEFPVQPRNVVRAKELVKEAGFTRVPVNMQILNATLDLQVAQIVQAMTRDAGFDITIEPQETGTAVARYFAGDFELFGGLWSGRVIRMAICRRSLLAMPDRILRSYATLSSTSGWRRRRASDLAARYQAYKEATAIYLAERPTIPIFHQVWVFAASAKLQGFRPYVDDIVRPVGLSLAK